MLMKPDMTIISSKRERIRSGSVSVRLRFMEVWGRVIKGLRSGSGAYDAQGAAPPCGVSSSRDGVDGPRPLRSVRTEYKKKLRVAPCL